VNKFVLSVCIFSSLFLISNCQNSPQKQVTTKASLPEMIKKEIKKQDFIPTPDSTISPEQMKNWSACNPMLDSLSIMYSDSFKTSNPQARVRFQDDYTAAQDKICVICGLPGGYKEYKWVMEAMSNSKNRAVVENAKLSVF
jgi:hypothetical protein